MKNEFRNRLNHVENKQHLIDEITESFTPYGAVNVCSLLPQAGEGPGMRDFAILET